MPNSVKSKCRQRFLAGPTAALPLAAVGLLVLFEQIGFGSALRCYQGQTSVKMPFSGSPVECPMQAYTCIKSTDYSQGLALYACQSTNCTMPGNGSYTIFTPPSVCYNSSGYPPQTFCCCYGDGCNGNLPPAPQLTSLLPSNSSVCSPRGTWGNWSDWSECPNSADPIFELLSEINMQTRNRDCLPQPSGCIRSGNGTFMCDGQHWEQRPCAKRSSGTASVSNLMPSGFMSMANLTG